MLCACGCGFPVESTGGKGRPGKYASGACRVRHHRAIKSRMDVTKREAAVTIMEQAQAQVKPILKYSGAKWKIAPWIASYFPAHLHYVEPFAGSAAVFFSKKKSKHEVLNDLNGSIINLFEVLRTQGEELARSILLTPWSEQLYAEVETDYDAPEYGKVERARRFLIRSWQAHGGFGGSGRSGWRHNGLKGATYPTQLWKQIPERLLLAADRLKDAELRSRPALEIIDYYNSQDCLLYVDPPYVLATRYRKYYAHEMDEEAHRRLLHALLQHKGMVLLSGYAHKLYDDLLCSWHREEMPTQTEGGNIRNEVLWINPRAAKNQQRSLFDAS